MIQLSIIGLQNKMIKVSEYLWLFLDFSWLILVTIVSESVTVMSQLHCFRQDTSHTCHDIIMVSTTGQKQFTRLRKYFTGKYFSQLWLWSGEWRWASVSHLWKHHLSSSPGQIIAGDNKAAFNWLSSFSWWNHICQEDKWSTSDCSVWFEQQWVIIRWSEWSWRQSKSALDISRQNRC